MTLIRNGCRVVGPESCAAGLEYDGTSCIACDFGEYKVRAGKDSCRECPTGETTDKRGATSRTQCRGRTDQA